MAIEELLIITVSIANFLVGCVIATVLYFRTLPIYRPKRHGENPSIPRNLHKHLEEDKIIPTHRRKPKVFKDADLWERTHDSSGNTHSNNSI